MNSSANPNEALLAPGTELAGFRILKDLGTGAASMLYLVQAPRTKQIWALKHVRKETEKDQRFLDQTESEFAVGSKLRHPNVRRVERLIKNRKLLRVSEMFLLMELVDGIALDRHAPMTVLELADIFTQVAEGLLYMHAQGFVHADMKPNNIIVTEAGHAKIIDLGQSCPIGTIKERIQGTMDYIAPEQVHRRAIKPETDVYNLGATMYWCVTRTHIPTAMTDRTGLGLAKDDHQIEKPTPACELNPEVSTEMSDLILECVSIDPRERPSMEAVRNRLQIIHLRLENAKPKHGNGTPPGGAS